MPIKINFDAQHNVIPPTFVLAKKNGNKIHRLPIRDYDIADKLNSCAEISFSVYKDDCDKISETFWDEIRDFKLLWCKEWNKFFEIYVTLNEADTTVKDIVAKSLGEAELSQINIYDMEINTEADIEREDYKPTVFYNASDPSASLLHRILAKAPHYAIGYIDENLKGIQRTFSFNDKSIYDVMQEISEELECLFVLDCKLDEVNNKLITRTVNVYELDTYGEDTTIFVSTDNLTDDITYETDEDSVKNCFKLEAGDDLMTATVRNCNPNGSDYLWYFSEKLRSDMSPGLKLMLETYDNKYTSVVNTRTYSLNYRHLYDYYNPLVRKYNNQLQETRFRELPNDAIGYSELMQAYYDTVDFYYYLKDSMMPTSELPETTAATEVEKLTTAAMTPISIQDLTETTDVTTVTNAILQMAQTLVDKRYKVEAYGASSESYSYNSTIGKGFWSAKFRVTKYSDESEAAISSNKIGINIDNNYENFVKQKISKMLSRDEPTEVYDIATIFNLNTSESDFKNNLSKFGGATLESLANCCQNAVDILIEQGMSKKDTTDGSIYNTLYLPYYNRLKWINEEKENRTSEIEIVETEQQSILAKRDGAQSDIDIQDWLDKWDEIYPGLKNEFYSFRREDVYKNENYISDGLDNNELFEKAKEFFEAAQTEIFKSATLQHSISASLKNLLVMPEFQPIVENFEIGNWIRIRVDDEIYKLRLLEYKIGSNDLSKIDVTFSDVTGVKDGITDVESILNQATSMATSYGSVAKQADNGEKSKQKLDNWVEKGLDLTKMQIVDRADNQNVVYDSHGVLCREYLPITDTYSPQQAKIINKGIYITDDNWASTKTALGNFVYTDPVSGNAVSAYGVIAETIVGKIILGENMGIYNSSGSMVFDKDKFEVKYTNTTAPSNSLTLSIQPSNSSFFTIKRGSTPIFDFDSYGNLELSGKITSTSGTIGGWIITQNQLYQETGDYTAYLAAYDGANASRSRFLHCTYSNNGFSYDTFAIRRDGEIRIGKKVDSNMVYYGFSFQPSGGIGSAENFRIYSEKNSTAKNLLSISPDGIINIPNGSIGCNSIKAANDSYNLINTNSTYETVEISSNAANNTNLYAKQKIDFKINNATVGELNTDGFKCSSINTDGFKCSSIRFTDDNANLLQTDYITDTSGTYGITQLGNYIRRTGIYAQYKIYFRVKNGNNDPVIAGSFDEEGVHARNLNTGSSKEIKENITGAKSMTSVLSSSDIYEYNLKAEIPEANGDLLQVQSEPPKRYGFVIGDGYNTPEEVLSRSGGKEINLYSMTSVLWKACQEMLERIEILEGNTQSV